MMLNAGCWGYPSLSDPWASASLPVTTLILKCLPEPVAATPSGLTCFPQPTESSRKEASDVSKHQHGEGAGLSGPQRSRVAALLLF